jgi:hypothetical protein
MKQEEEKKKLKKKEFSHIFPAARVVYKDNPRDDSVEAQADMKALQDEGYEMIVFAPEVLSLDPTKYQGIIFHNKKTNHFLIASAGTRPTVIQDLNADLEFSNDQIPTKYFFAREMNEHLMQHIQKQADPSLPPPTFEYIGHSLGALMSQLLSVDMVIRQQDLELDKLIDKSIGSAERTRLEDTILNGDGKLKDLSDEIKSGKLTEEDREEYALEEKITRAIETYKKEILPSEIDQHIIQPALKQWKNKYLQEHDNEEPSSEKIAKYTQQIKKTERAKIEEREQFLIEANTPILTSQCIEEISKIVTKNKDEVLKHALRSKIIEHLEKKDPSFKEKKEAILQNAKAIVSSETVENPGASKIIDRLCRNRDRELDDVFDPSKHIIVQAKKNHINSHKAQVGKVFEIVDHTLEYKLSTWLSEKVGKKCGPKAQKMFNYVSYLFRQIDVRAALSNATRSLAASLISMEEEDPTRRKESYKKLKSEITTGGAFIVVTSAVLVGLSGMVAGAAAGAAAGSVAGTISIPLVGTVGAGFVGAIGGGIGGFVKGATKGAGWGNHFREVHSNTIEPVTKVVKEAHHTISSHKLDNYMNSFVDARNMIENLNDQKIIKQISEDSKISTDLINDFSLIKVDQNVMEKVASSYNLIPIKDLSNHKSSSHRFVLDCDKDGKLRRPIQFYKVTERALRRIFDDIAVEKGGLNGGERARNALKVKPIHKSLGESLKKPVREIVVEPEVQKVEVPAVKVLEPVVGKKSSKKTSSKPPVSKKDLSPNKIKERSREEFKRGK